MNDNRPYGVLILRPHWMLLLIGEWFFMLLFLLCIVVAVCLGGGYGTALALVGAAVLLLYLVIKVVHLLRLEYILTDEQLIVKSGVFSYSTEYLELYRVVDYLQRRSFIEQIVGLKTIVIISGDRNTPYLSIIGVRNDMDFVPIIRDRVENCKKIRKIYEITNR